MREIVYFISDTHFWHNPIVQYCNRPFSSIQDMNEKLIENWNNTVKDEDIVYFLGDFCLGNNNQAREICNRLKGYKIIVLGNHDDGGIEHWLNIGFQEAYKEPIKFRFVNEKSEMKEILLSHVPQIIGSNQVNIHGHIHDAKIENEYNGMNPKNHINISVENIGYTPISFDKIYQEYLKERKEF